MPAKNRIKIYAADAYYHVYNRGVEKRIIFCDRKDFAVFFSLLKRYLGGDGQVDTNGRPYRDLSAEIELVAYCLMPNHFHLLLYQLDPVAITDLMRRVETSYTMYFNKRYQRVGPLFQGCYKAALLTTEPYLIDISRYIHRNPGGNWELYPYSSYRYYTGSKAPAWVKPRRILQLYQQYGENYAIALQGLTL